MPGAVARAVSNKTTFSRLVDMGIAEPSGRRVNRMGKRVKIRGVLRDAHATEERRHPGRDSGERG